MAKEKKKLKPIDTPIYGYWSALFMSFFSKRLYVDVAKRWRGIGILYLLLAITVSSIPLSLRVAFDFNKTFNQQIIMPLSKLPTIYVQNGKVIFDKPMPYLIRNDRNQVVIIIDTTGKIEKFSNEYPDLNILINKNNIYFRLPTPELLGMSQTTKNTGVPIVQPLDKGMNTVFDGKKIIQDNAVSGLKYASQLLIYPVVVTILYSITVVVLLAIAFLGQVFSKVFFSFSLSFMKSSRLLMVAATPMLVVLAIMLAFNLVFPGLGVILLTLMIAYYSYGVYSFRGESRQMVFK
ncbi:hypothetical protein EP47_07140 [Legionella norrlandica]|uniref:DUF1189 domain-containing protein n=1 Tax=Legionella norrlandica TaxID=1498499 RepID=A0A0A2T936_9GAMM|nr:DUF1189 family protein [Legionella norrlandica]KGP63903.1 hypothetical protein EP47_07140 [Legionella norrlandica]